MGVIRNLFEKRSFDNQQWLQDFLRGRDYGTTSNSGTNVGPENAIRNSAVFNAGWILSNTIASLPLFLYKRIPGGKERANDHSLFRLLHTQPNELMTAFSLREMMMWHLLFWGNTYLNILYNTYDDVVALWPLLPWRMDPQWINGKIVYKYRLPDNTETIIPNKDILHIPGMSFNGIVGKSVLSCARETVGLGLALEEFGARFFGHGAQFGGFVQHPKTLGPKAKKYLEESLKQKYTGINNAHKVMILEEGMEYKQNVIPPNDAQFLESRKFEVVEVARFFNLPPHMLKDLDRSTFNNIEHQGLEFVIYTLSPWLKRIEQAEDIKLLKDTEKKTLFIEHLVEGLLRGDIKTRYEAYSEAIEGRWLTVNEVRAKENMPPVPGGDDLAGKVDNAQTENS